MKLQGKYIKPPIIEAICEFRLSDDTEWDPTIPGLLFSKINSDFPFKNKRKIQKIYFKKNPQGGFQQEVTISERAIFLSKDKKKEIQVGNRELAIICLKPYPSWNKFQPIIKLAYKTLDSIISLKGFKRIGLRYINKIQFRDKNIDLDEFFEFRPYFGKKIPQMMSSFNLTVLLPFSEGCDSCKVILHNTISQNNEMGFILDFDYFLVKPFDNDSSNCLTWIEEAHNKIEALFEGSITDKLREIFGVKK